MQKQKDEVIGKTLGVALGRVNGQVGSTVAVLC